MDGSTVVFLMGVFPLVAMVIVFRHGEKIKARYEAWIDRANAPDEEVEFIDDSDDFPSLDEDQNFTRNKSSQDFRDGGHSLASSRKQQIRGAQDIRQTRSHRSVD